MINCKSLLGVIGAVASALMIMADAKTVQAQFARGNRGGTSFNIGIGRGGYTGRPDRYFGPGFYSAPRFRSYRYGSAHHAGRPWYFYRSGPFEYYRPYRTSDLAGSQASDHPGSAVITNLARSKGADYLGQAESAFRARDYHRAARMVQHAVVESPNEGKMHLFLSQALLAVDDYSGSAKALRQALPLLDPEDWGYIVKNFRRYYSSAEYVKQIKRLEKFRTEHREATHALFLLGYHYGFLGYPETARRELARSIQLDSHNALAVRLLSRFGGSQRDKLAKAAEQHNTE